VRNFLGKYALALGDGILIHGTTDKKSLGRPASHGCIRLPADLLANMWKLTKVGTDVYIFDSRPAQTAAAGSLPERHSDLDYRRKSGQR
jgi:lipoprotein-anchoring transpeptidase ErfK/SrfK